MTDLEKLAIDGGTPVRTRPWPSYDKGNVLIDEDDVRAAQQAVRSRLLFRYDTRRFDETEVGQLEREMEDFLGVRFALATTSGTTALSLALLGNGIGRGDVVGVPAFTFPGAASAAYLSGADIRVIEVDDDLNMDLADLARKLPELKALIVCHMRGVASPINEIRRMTQPHVLLIEDAVPVFGTSYAGKKLGTFGDVGCFSFQADKAISCGEGGLVVTDNQETFERMARMAGTFEGRLRRHTDAHNTQQLIDERSEPILSWRLDEVRAALARVQLSRVDRRHGTALANYAAVAEAVDSIPGWRRRACPGVPDGIAGDSLIIRAPDQVDSLRVVDALNAEGIEARLFNDPRKPNARCFVNWLFAFPGTTEEERRALAPRTADLLERSIDIQVSPVMVEDDRADLIRALTKVATHLWIEPSR